LPPTERHERTGLFTPPGISSRAREKSCSDRAPITPPHG
jgi:hypothetical protein